MSVQARYSGTCGECGSRWSEDDPIRTSIAYGASDAIRVWQHVVCPDVPSDFEHHAPVCETCWLSHPEGACDR